MHFRIQFFCIAVLLSGLILGTTLPVQSSPQSNPSAQPVARDKDALYLLLPPEAQKVHKELPPVAKRIIWRKLNEETTVIPGVLVISHKQAFVRGKAVGKNVFDLIDKQVEKMFAGGQLKEEWAPSVRAFFGVARSLTPEQRAAWVDLISRDVEDSEPSDVRELPCMRENS